MRLLGRDPSLDQLVPHGQGQRVIAVAVGSAVAIPGKGSGEDGARNCFRRPGADISASLSSAGYAADLKYRHFGPCIADGPKPPALRVPWALCAPLNSEAFHSRTGSPLISLHEFCSLPKADEPRPVVHGITRGARVAPSQAWALATGVRGSHTLHVALGIPSILPACVLTRALFRVRAFEKCLKELALTPDMRLTCRGKP